MKNYIQVNNFRKYISTPEIELNDLNFFVGTNSSGKSTLVKAYMLITKFIELDELFEIDFTSKDYNHLNINDFERQICKYSLDEKSVRIELGFDNYIFNLVLTPHTRSNYARVLEYTVKDVLNDVIYEYKYVKERTIKEVDSFDYDTNQVIYVDELEEKIFHIKLINNEKHKNNVLNLIEQEILKTEDIDILNDLNEELRVVENSNDLNDIILSTNYVFEFNKGFRKIAQEVLKQRSLPILMKFKHKISPSIDSVIKKYRLLNISDRSFKEYDGKIREFRSIEDFNETNKSFIPNGLDLSVKIFDLLLKLNSFKSIFLPLTFRKYTNLSSIVDKSNDLAQLIHQYYNKDDRYRIKSDEFIKYWIGKEQFNIGEDFEINFYGGEAYEILIHENGIKIPLVDKGTGNIQIFKILLLVATYSNCTIILEEPELNLHPSLQSKLADFIVAVNAEKGKRNFMIETHSEYLIRRLQVLVAKGEVKDSDLAITYFPSEYNQQPYQLNIKADGTLDKNFGTGFFDEASNHTLELIKFKRLSHN